MDATFAHYRDEKIDVKIGVKIGHQLGHLKVLHRFGANEYYTIVFKNAKGF